jgi:single-stranded DNA-specific DHH superfamily exonuclease
MLDYRGYELIPSTKRGCKGQSETRVEQACRNCTNIKKRQTDARDKSLNIIEQIIEDQNLLENKLLVIRLKPELATDKNLTGLIANELMSKYQRPVLVLRYKETEEETGEKDKDGKPIMKKIISWEGSGRGYDKSSFNDFREFLKSTGLVMYADGHANALGVGILDENFDNFIKYSNEALKDFDFTPCYKVDFIFDGCGCNFNPNDIVEIAGLKPIWGQGVEEPLVVLENLKIHNSNIQLMSPDKKPTLKITLPNGLCLIKFRSCIEEYEKLYSELGCITINVVGRCEQNIWNGIINP